MFDMNILLWHNNFHEAFYGKPDISEQEKHEKYDTVKYNKRIDKRNIKAKRILMLLEHRCMGKVGLRQGVRSLLEELDLLETDEELKTPEGLMVKEAALDYLKGLGFIDLAEESKYHHNEELSELLKQKTYGITVNDDIVLTFAGVKECEIMHKRILGYFVSL